MLDKVENQLDDLKVERLNLLDETVKKHFNLEVLQDKSEALKDSVVG